MAPPSTIRAVTHRLTTTPVNELPQLASFLAASLSECGDLLGASSSTKTSKSSNPESHNAVQLHKLKTRLTSLLLDRSVEGRWTAVVLIKAVIEVGQMEVLRESEAWVLVSTYQSDPSLP
jgi:pre-rRNA-processing protein RIX1